MSASAETALFDACRDRVGALLAAGAGIDVVERTIDVLPLPADERCALWLWAGPRLAEPRGAGEPLDDNRQVVIDRLVALG